MELEKIKNNLCLQSYKITMARYQLSAVELRIMSLCILKLKDEQMNGFNEDVKPSKDLISRYKSVEINNADITIGTNYTAIRTALRSLTRRTMELEDKKGLHIFGLMTYACYSNDKTKIRIDLNTLLVPELLRLGKNYTKYGLEFLFKTQCKYSIRWYQLACHWKNKGYFYISIDEIREIFGLKPTAYKRTERLTQCVIKNPLKELTSKADTWLEIVKTHKNGRTIKGYTLKILTKKSANILKEKKQPAFFIEYWEKKEKHYTHMCLKYGVDLHFIKEKIKERKEIKYKNQTHYKNATDLYVACVFADFIKKEFKDIKEEIKII